MGSSQCSGNHTPQVQVNSELAQGTQGGVSRAVGTTMIPHLGDYISPFPHFPLSIMPLPSIHPPPQSSYKGFPAGSSGLNPSNCSSWLLGEELKSLSLPQGLDLV